VKIEQLAKALSDSQVEEDASKKKEALRLAKEPFKTKIEPSSEKTLEQLRGWIPPKGGGAYILLEKKFYEWGGTSDGSIAYTLYTMFINSRPDQIEKLRYNVQVKGMRIIHWDNFPTLNDSNLKQAQLARAHVNPESGVSAYDSLLIAINNHTKGDSITKDNKISELEEKLKAANAKAEKAAKGEKVAA
jgi:hypothetical protein